VSANSAKDNFGLQKKTTDEDITGKVYGKYLDLRGTSNRKICFPSEEFYDLCSREIKLGTSVHGESYWSRGGGGHSSVRVINVE
jgi:hypothetical protein